MTSAALPSWNPGAPKSPIPAFVLRLMRQGGPDHLRSASRAVLHHRTPDEHWPFSDCLDRDGKTVGVVNDRSLTPTGRGIA